MKILTLIDNNRDKRNELLSEEGLSFYIRHQNKQILFDTGRTSDFLSNAKKLGVKIEEIDFVVISHGHLDHGGGLRHFLERNKKAKVYISKAVKNDFFFKVLFIKSHIGLDQNLFDENPDRFIFIDDFFEISYDIYLVSKINEKSKQQVSNRFMYVRKGQVLIKDDFTHELVMILKDSEEMNVFTGCSHNGVVNILDTVRVYFPTEKIKYFVGGFHLVRLPKFSFTSVSKNEINAIGNKIIDEDIEMVFTGHCTGKSAYKKLRNILGSKIMQISSGFKISND